MMSLQNMVRGLENDAPAKQLLQRWAHDADTLRFWRASSNFVYTYANNDKPYFLRFIHETDNRIEQIQAELDFVLYAIEQGYPAAAPVRSRDGCWIETVSTENGLYYGVAFERARGQHIPLNRMSEEHFAAWGRSLASLHRLSESYAPRATPCRNWEDTLIWIASILQRDPGKAGLLHTLHALRARLAELPAAPGSMGMIHYDFEFDNLFYVPEEARYCAIDFDDAMVHWFMMDVASALSDLLEQESGQARLQINTFLDGYRSVKALDEYDLSLIPVFRQFADLYTYARLQRSIEELDESSSPEWAVQLRDKLLSVCDRIRERCRS
ncbi:phosphotransferase enzyme family protein [Cohnella nanjingensis]|uniref:Phosphotransferase n=1 Tax=Cohnella nanjingensis TaxID=1387779 RepID=A0A7X0RQJ0_9BACL|nr:phosphotransferase [Cohnella nanjingensis]MBB6670429.1 phosphotransferase [Cohnella nanjingensis]